MPGSGLTWDTGCMLERLCPWGVERGREEELPRAMGEGRESETGVAAAAALAAVRGGWCLKGGWCAREETPERGVEAYVGPLAGGIVA